MAVVTEEYSNFHISVAATVTPNLNSDKSPRNLAKIFSRFNLINILTVGATPESPISQSDGNHDEDNEDPTSGNDGPDSHSSLIQKLSSVLTKMGSPIFSLQWSPVSSVHSEDQNGQGEDYRLQEGDIPAGNQQDLARARDKNAGSRSMRKLASRFVTLKQSMFSMITDNERPSSNDSPAPNDALENADLDKDSTELSQNQYSTALGAALAQLKISGKPTRYYVYSKEKYISNRNKNLEKGAATSKKVVSPASICKHECSFNDETPLRAEHIADDISSPSAHESSDTIGLTLTACSNLSFNCVLCRNRM